MEKVIAIVGMGEGISYAVALRFGQAGYRVGMIARNEEKLKVCQEKLYKDGVASYFFVADAGEESRLTAAFDELKEKMGDPEVLLYNAAVIKNRDILEESITSLAEDFKVNVAGALHSVKQVLDSMKKENKGTLLFTGGGLALSPLPQYGSLALGKAAILNLTRQIMGELNPTRIKVGMVVVKGFVKTNSTKYNPTAIAAEFWKIHNQERKDFGIIEY